MITPTAESWPRESFLMRVLVGSWNAWMRDCARGSFQFGKNRRAVPKAWVAVASSGYFWLSRTKHMRESTRAFS